MPSAIIDVPGKCIQIILRRAPRAHAHTQSLAIALQNLLYKCIHMHLEAMSVQLEKCLMASHAVRQTVKHAILLSSAS